MVAVGRGIGIYRELPCAHGVNRLAGVNFFANMPRDPFADDPNDPASFLEEDDHVEPLSEEDRLAVIHDLAMVQEFARVLSPRGIDGIFFFCEDCEENHFYAVSYTHL